MTVYGAGPMPTPSVLQQMATESYNKSPSPTVDGLQLIVSTPTLKFYKHPVENTIVVAIRGTEPTDAADVKADASIAVGQLQNSQRFQQDLATLVHFQSQFPFTQFDYYGVGHSLGGAILDLFLKMGLLKQGISYNPAIQPGDFQSAIPNKRIYTQEDPLYKLMGRHATNTEVRAPRKKAWWERAIEKVPYAGKAFNLYKAHQLDNFVGGGRSPSSKFAAQLRSVGVEPSAYLKEAQRRAKGAGYPEHLLGFADDGEHKLAIPNRDGRVIKFGRVGYGDHQIWGHLERTGKAPKGKAEEKRRTFHRSHSTIKGDWKSDKYSPNNLALRVLW